jgi:hypothetical protein
MSYIFIQLRVQTIRGLCEISNENSWYKTRGKFYAYMCENKLLKKHPTQYGTSVMKTHVFCNIKPCRLINICKRIRIINSSDSESGNNEDMLVHTHQSTRPNILKHFRLH